MNAKHSSRGQTVPAVAVALGAIAVVAVAFVVLVSRPAAPAGGGASPSAPVATPRPSTPASPATPAPSSPAEPSPTATPKAPTEIDLESALFRQVRLTIDDTSGWLRDAVSGHPREGMSVRWHDSLVEQVAPNVVRITWVSFPDEEVLDLGILYIEDELSIAIVQRGPYANTDALGEDRIVVLTFDRPVNAKTLDVKVIDDMVH
ncbi:MAG TPA: hypothetical protein VFJ71_00785 [Candidatus Limnocylindrales bacterium]|nr:hypothetical protein [Candidatus Limnocylindrales bacterium]